MSSSLNFVLTNIWLWTSGEIEPGHNSSKGCDPPRPRTTAAFLFTSIGSFLSIREILFDRISDFHNNSEVGLCHLTLGLSYGPIEIMKLKN